MRTRYVVVENTPGYLPESEPVEFTNKRDAMGYMADLARELRDDGYHTWGSARDGQIWAERDAGGLRSLGRVIELLPADD